MLFWEILPRRITQTPSDTRFGQIAEHYSGVSTRPLYSYSRTSLLDWIMKCYYLNNIYLAPQGPDGQWRMERWRRVDFLRVKFLFNVYIESWIIPTILFSCVFNANTSIMYSPNLDNNYR